MISFKVGLAADLTGQPHHAGQHQCQAGLLPEAQPCYQTSSLMSCAVK